MDAILHLFEGAEFLHLGQRSTSFRPSGGRSENWWNSIRSNVADGAACRGPRTGRWLAYADRTSPTGPFAVHRISLEAGEKQRLTSPDGGVFGDVLPTFSPDGRTLAFVRLTATSGDIYLMP